MLPAQIISQSTLGPPFCLYLLDLFLGINYVTGKENFIQKMLSTESSRSLILSTEEQEELARSNKKVKNVGHAGFQEGMDTSSSSPKRSNGYWN